MKRLRKILQANHAHLAWFWIFGWVLAQSSLGSQPPSIVVFPLTDFSQNKDAEHWRWSVPLFLKHQLRQTRAVRVLPDNSMEFGQDETAMFAARQVGPESDSDETLCRKLGEAVSADAVVWGVYRVKEGRWKVSLEVLKLGGNKPLQPIELRAVGSEGLATNWFKIISQFREKLFIALGATPTKEERERMDQPIAHSGKAFEMLSLALAAQQQGTGPQIVREALTKAIAADPECPMALESLSAVLIGQGQADQAERMAKRAIALDPMSAVAYHLLGVSFLARQQSKAAEVEFSEAAALAPMDPLPLLRLGIAYGREEGNWERARQTLERAESLAPLSAEVHAELGVAFANCGAREEALKQLTLAARYVSGSDGEVLQSLGQAYSLLRDTPKAIEYYQRCVSLAHQAGLRPAAVQDLETTLANLREQLTPQFVRFEPPIHSKPEDLESTLWSKLTPKEYASFYNPFLATPEMASWAETAVAGRTNDLEKARALFSKLPAHFQAQSTGRDYTAEEAFQVMSNPNVVLSCQDYTFLFVALARQVALEAYYVAVNKDCDGHPVAHACAGVVIGDRAVLVDPVYYWFGPPHKEYKFQDDLQAVALFLAQSDRLELARLAVKLAPSSASAHFCLAEHLARLGQSDEAHSEMVSGLALETKSPEASLARAIVDLYGDRPHAGIQQLQVLLQPEDPPFPAVLLRYYLGIAYERDGNLDRAREQYLRVLSDSHPNTAPEDVRKRLQAINKKLALTDGRGTGHPGGSTQSSAAPVQGVSSGAATPVQTKR